MVDVQGSTLVHTGDNLVLCAVEAVHSNNAGLLLGVGIVRVGGVQVVLKHGQAVQVLNLGGRQGWSARQRDASFTQQARGFHPHSTIYSPKSTFRFYLTRC